MARRIVMAHRAAIVAAFAVCVVAAHADAAAAQDQDDSSVKLLELGLHYGAPERLSGSISGVFFFGERNPKNRMPAKNVTLRAVAGEGAAGVGIGHRGSHYGPFGPEALLTVTRTFSSPRGGTGRSTYVGAEVGYVAMWRFSIGVARQVDGPSDRRDTILTWNVGAQVPYGFWRW